MQITHVQECCDFNACQGHVTNTLHFVVSSDFTEGSDVFIDFYRIILRPKTRFFCFSYFQVDSGYTSVLQV